LGGFATCKNGKVLICSGDTDRFLPLDDFDPIEDVAVLPVVAEKRIGPLAASRMI
jgi:hypothetical protein